MIVLGRVVDGEKKRKGKTAEEEEEEEEVGAKGRRRGWEDRSVPYYKSN